MNRWFIWLVCVGYASTKNIELDDEYNSTSIDGWISSGDCTGNSWKWNEHVTRWNTCAYSNIDGPCNLETFYWPTLEANMIYVDLTLGAHCPDFITCDNSITVYVFNELTNGYGFVTKAPTKESIYDFSTTSYTQTIKISNFTDRVKLKFETRRFCGFILKIKVYFKKCDQAAVGLATFDNVSAPNDTNALKHTGQCVSNAQSTFKDGPFRSCFWNGSSTLESGCTCMKGFRQLNQTCVAGMCGLVAAGLATFDTVTTPNDTNALKHTGQCVSNAQSTFKDGPFRSCFWNGSSTLESGCTCMKGFRQLNQTCVVDDSSSSVPVLFIVIGLVIGIGTAIVVLMVGVYRYRRKPTRTRNVEMPSSEIFNNNNSEHFVEMKRETFYEMICKPTNEMHLHSRVNSETGNCFDVFICYSSNDREWVKDTLLKELESRGKKACIDFRDFLVGAHICENITEAIYGSRKTIAVLSPDFLNSVYCKHELHQALSRIADHQVIPVLYRACGVPDDLKHKTYLEWCHDDVKPYFWEQLIKAIDNTSYKNNIQKLYEQY